MNEEEKISQTLDGFRHTLSKTEKDLLWNNINKKTVPNTPTPSPYLFIFNYKKHMAPIALALILMLSTTGIVAASESARPGDTLFLVDQTVEDIRLALASDDKKTRLEAEFAAERLLELSSILKESIRKNNSLAASSTASSTATSTTSFEAEADVFSDTTIVEVEINDRKTVFETSVDTREEVIDEIVHRFGVDRATVEAALDFEIEDRASQEKDKEGLTLTGKDEVRVNEAIAVTLSYLLNSRLTEETREGLFAELATLLDGVPVNLDSSRIRIKDGKERIEIRNDGDDSRLEIRDEENRIRIREKDGEIRIETKNDNWEDDLNDDDSSDDADEDEDTSRPVNSNSFEAEADVFFDTTFVEVEINDRKTVFETTADTREEVIDEIVRRFGVARATVEAALDFKVEDKEEQEKEDEYEDEYEYEDEHEDDEEDEYEDNDDDDEYRDSDDSNESEEDNSSSNSEIRIEVKVEDNGTAEVKMKYNGREDEFKMTYVSKAALITALSLRSGLSEIEVSNALDLEI